MADSVNSPFLSIAPAEPAGLKSAKNPNFASKSSNNDDFSRVLDKQQSRDKAAEQRADAQASRAETSGKALPAEGNRAADGASNDGEFEVAASRSGIVDAQAGASQAAVPEEPPSDEALAALTRDTLAQVPASLNPADVAESDQTLAALRSAAAGQDASLNEALVSPDAAIETSKLAPTAAASTVTGTPVPAKELGVQSLTNAGPGSATGLINNTAPGTGALDDAALGTAQSGLQNIELTRSSAAAQTGEALQRGVLNANDGRGSSAQFEPVGLNRSTGDWLRAGMGSENVGQRSAADVQFDGLVELARGAAVLQRGDSQGGVNPATSTVAGLTPTPPAAGAAPAAATANTPLPPEYSLTRAPDDVEFPGELTARMKTLVRDGVREARLQLHPAELGRLQVTVTTEGDQTKVVFTAENTAARDLIEQSMPKLREMLEESGLQLAQSDVGHQDLQGETERGEGELSGEQRQAASEQDDGQQPVFLSSGVTSSRIDTYI